MFTSLSKSKKSMNILDFLIIRGQQVFEEGRDINPIEITIEDNRVRNLFEKYKDNKVRFKLTESRAVLLTTQTKYFYRQQVSNQQSMHF